MADAFGAVEAAIAEVTKARNLIQKKKSKQVSSADEIDQLKAVAYAWLQTHRPAVASHGSKPDLKQVDLAYQVVLEATARNSARATYLTALQNAKRLLVEVRSFVVANLHIASTPNATSTTDASPNFAPLASNPEMQAILQRRWDEVQRCISCKSNLAATVMMGGLLESLLLARINASPNKPMVFTAKAAPRDKSGKTLLLGEWKLIHMVEVGHEFKWVSKSAKDIGNVLRDFRNYIHPHKELTDGILISEEDTGMFWEVTKAITRQVLSSVGKVP